MLFQLSVVQYSDALPVVHLKQVYTGSDGSFVFVEDDGETLDYESSNIKTTSLSWKDIKTLSWTVGGTFEGDSTLSRSST